MIKFRSVAKSGLSSLLGFTFLSFTALAAPSVATVTSAVPFMLDGHAVSSPGVSSFPVVVGDTVTTSDGPAVLLFHDGSTVKLAENSSVRLNAVGANTNVVLLVGALDYKLIPGSNIKVSNLEKPASAEPTSAVQSARPSVRATLTSPTFIVSASGAAVGVATSLMASSSTSAVGSSTVASATEGTTGATATARSVSATTEEALCKRRPPVSCYYK
jgi:hypothetical protein